jgi:hypothetical protein
VRDAWVLAAVAFLLAASFTTFFGWNRLRVDATAYWNAGTHLRSGEPLYATAPVVALDKAYLYPPAFAAAFAPLTLLPPLWGYATWMALELLFAVALARACAELAGLRSDDREARRTALAVALLAAVVPVYDNVSEGQVNLLVAWLCALAVLEAERGRSVRAAFALAAAVHVKVVPIVLAGAFAVWRRPRLLGWLAVALVTIALLPWPWRIAALGVRDGVAAGVRDQRDFWHAILWPAASADDIAGVPQAFAPNSSVRGTLARLFVAGTPLSPFPADADRRGPLVAALPPTVVRAAGTMLGLGALGAALWACRRVAVDPSRRVAAAGLLLTAGGLAGPTFWQHHFVVLAIAGAGLWRILAAWPRRPQVAAWLCALGPIVATVTVPFCAVMFFGASEEGLYRDIRELGLPTAAVLAFFVTGVVLTLRRSEPAA